MTTTGGNGARQRTRRGRAALPAVLLLGMALVPDAARACTQAAAMDGWSKAFLTLQPMAAPPRGLGYVDALSCQKAFVEKLGAELGPKVGYKVGLTNADVQRQFGVQAPARGILLASMLVPDGSTVPAAFGARPVVEADLIVSIKDEGIMRASTPQEAAQHIADMIPFIELADLSWAQGTAVDYGALVTANVGARLGVMGRRMRLPKDPEFVAALAEMTVIMEDGVSPPAQSKGASIMTHPFWSVVWLVRDLAARGETLRAGDLVSLGSFGTPRTPVAGSTVRVRYEGLPDIAVPRVTVTFK